MYLHCPVDWPTLPDPTARYGRMMWRDWEDEGGEVKRRSKDGWAERKWRNYKGRMKGVKWKYIDKGMNNLRD